MYPINTSNGIEWIQEIDELKDYVDSSIYDIIKQYAGSKALIDRFNELSKENEYLDSTNTELISENTELTRRNIELENSLHILKEEYKKLEEYVNGLKDNVQYEYSID